MMILNPNCSEATMRIKLDNLNQTEKKQVIHLIDTIKRLSDGAEDGDISEDIIKTKFNIDEEEAKNKWWDTYWQVKDIFGTECIEIKGETPYNESEWLNEQLKKLDFHNKLQIEEESE